MKTHGEKSSSSMAPPPIYSNSHDSESQAARLALGSSSSSGSGPSKAELLAVPQPERLTKVRSASAGSVDTARTSISTTLEDAEEAEIKESLSLEEEEVVVAEEKVKGPSHQESPKRPTGAGSTANLNQNQASSSPDRLKLKQNTESAACAKEIESKPVRLPTCRSPFKAVNKKTVVRAGSGVRFGHLGVHEFPCGLGDHPAVQSGGPPIRLEYNYAEESNGTSTTKEPTTTRTPTAANPVYSYTIPIEDYEFNRPRRRTLAELLVPADTRRQWLLQEQSIDAADLARAERSVQRVQRQRHASQMLQQWEEWQLAHEAIRRWWQRRRLFKKSSGWNNNNNNSSQGDANTIVAHDWCRQYKEQKLAESRERRLQKAKSATF